MMATITSSLIIYSSFMKPLALFLLWSKITISKFTLRKQSEEWNTDSGRLHITHSVCVCRPVCVCVNDHLSVSVTLSSCPLFDWETNRKLKAIMYLRSHSMIRSRFVLYSYGCGFLLYRSYDLRDRSAVGHLYIMLSGLFDSSVLSVIRRT